MYILTHNYHNHNDLATVLNYDLLYQVSGCRGSRMQCAGIKFMGKKQFADRPISLEEEHVGDVYRFSAINTSGYLQYQK